MERSPEPPAAFGSRERARGYGKPLEQFTVEPAPPPPPTSWAPGLERHLSLRRARWCLALGTGTLAASLCVCYASWLQQGCATFMPFLSDLGLQGLSSRVFRTGMPLVALLLGVWFLHVVHARTHLVDRLEADQLFGRHDLLNKSLTLTGGMVMFSTFGIGFVPWDRFTFLHFAFAAGVFYAGCAWAFLSALLSRLLGGLALGRWDPCELNQSG